MIILLQATSLFNSKLTLRFFRPTTRLRTACYFVSYRLLNRSQGLSHEATQTGPYLHPYLGSYPWDIGFDITEYCRWNDAIRQATDPFRMPLSALLFGLSASSKSNVVLQSLGSIGSQATRYREQGRCIYVLISKSRITDILHDSPCNKYTCIINITFIFLKIFFR